MMQLNRAKFMVNGGSGYVLKPPPMCKGSAKKQTYMYSVKSLNIPGQNFWECEQKSSGRWNGLQKAQSYRWHGAFTF